MQWRHYLTSVSVSGLRFTKAHSLAAATAGRGAAWIAIANLIPATKKLGHHVVSLLSRHAPYEIRFFQLGCQRDSQPPELML